MNDLIERLHRYAEGGYGDWSRTAKKALVALKVARGDEWQPIETAPEAGAFIATGHNYGDPRHGRHYAIAKRQGDFFVEASEWSEACDLDYLTHWVPLPAPPKEARNG